MGDALPSPFVQYPHPALASKASATAVDTRLIAIGDRLRQAAVEAKAYGLAAAHIGEVEPVMVLNVTPDGPQADYVLYFNPKVTARSPDMVAGPEASVSLP